MEIDEKDYEEDDNVVEKDVCDFGRKNFGELASPYLTAYLYKRRCLYKQYGIRMEDDGKFMTGDSTLSVYNTSDISIKGRNFKRTRGLWELLIRKTLTELW